MVSKRLIGVILRISISIISIGILFTIMHWPYGSVILVIGLGSILVFYPLRFYAKNTKSLLDYSKLGVVISFVFYYSFRVFHWPYGYIFTLITQIAFVLFLVLYIREVFITKEDATEEEKTSNATKRSYILYAISGITILAGALFKIMHWPYGNELLIFGLLFAAISVFMGEKELEE